MRNYLFAFSTILLLVGALYYAPFSKGDPRAKEIEILSTLTEFISAKHYRPVPLNDDFSEKAYIQFLKALDGGKRFLTKNEVSQMEVYKYEIDDLLEQKSLAFIDLADNLTESAIDRAKNIYLKVIDEPLSLKMEGNIELDRDKKDFAENAEDLEDRWRRLIQYDVLLRYNDALKKAKEDTTATSIPTEAVMLEEIKEKVEKNLNRWFDRLEELRRSDRFEVYVNSIMHAFDPHTDYYTPKDKEDFNLRFSGKLEGIGAQLSSEDGFTKVTKIIPGGPAWKGKLLEAEDLIVKVAQDGEEPIDIEGMRLDDVVSKIRGKKGTKVVLTVKKKDGSFQDIPIVRDIIIMEEGNARSAIVQKEGLNDRIGYIYLPSFYADFSDKNGRNCYRDMKKEIEKLNQAGVDGIVLDLRYNGGGSLQDVVKIGGMFVEKGPIVQVKTRDRDPYVLKDKDENVQYDGPLVIMVNHSSASASEILAAAMQDYNRAVIVGSTSSFGKGTVQRFFDLDRIIFSNEHKPLGEVKVTVQKFYRINGGSTQMKGVEPDIVLPDAYQNIKTGEKNYDNALMWDEIDSVSYAQNVYHIGDKQRILQNSNLRIKESDAFQLIAKQAKVLSERKEDTEFPLDFTLFKDKIAERDSLSQAFRLIGKDTIPGLIVDNLEVDKAYIQADSSRIGRNEAFIEKIYKDIYLNESIHILTDMIAENK